MTPAWFYPLVITAILVGLAFTAVREPDFRRVVFGLGGGVSKVAWAFVRPLLFLVGLFGLVKLIKWAWYF